MSLSFFPEHIADANWGLRSQGGSSLAFSLVPQLRHPPSHLPTFEGEPSESSRLPSVDQDRPLILVTPTPSLERQMPAQESPMLMATTCVKPHPPPSSPLDHLRGRFPTPTSIFYPRPPRVTDLGTGTLPESIFFYPQPHSTQGPPSESSRTSPSSFSCALPSICLPSVADNFCSPNRTSGCGEVASAKSKNSHRSSLNASQPRKPLVWRFVNLAAY